MTGHTANNKPLEEKFYGWVETTNMKLGNPHPSRVFNNKNDHKCPPSDICIHKCYENHNVRPQAEINF